jgi:negative modulator of initiation of replication
MQTIEIDDDIYEFLRRNGDFGETPSVVLRRFVPLPSDTFQTLECPICGKVGESEKTFLIGGKTVHHLKCGHIFPNGKQGLGIIAAVTDAGGPENGLMRFIADPVFVCQNATDKWLGILGFAAKDKGERFDQISKLSGRRRRWFGRSREEIEMSGKSTHPHAIPGSSFWALTNTSTPLKREMLTKVLDYSSEEIQTAAKAIF